MFSVRLTLKGSASYYPEDLEKAVNTVLHALHVIHSHYTHL